MDTTAPNPTRHTTADFPAASVDDSLRERLRKQPVVARTADSPGRAEDDVYDKALPVPGEIFAVNGASIANYDGEALKDGGSPKPAAPIRLADQPDYALPPEPPPEPTPPPQAPPASAAPPAPPLLPKEDKIVEPEPKPGRVLQPAETEEKPPPKQEPLKPARTPSVRTFRADRPEPGYPPFRQALAALAVLFLLIGGGLLVYVNHQSHRQAAALAAAKQQWQEDQDANQQTLEQPAVVSNPKSTVAPSSTAPGSTAGLNGVTAISLNGQGGSFYQNASNLTTGILPVSRLPASVTLQGNGFDEAGQLVRLDGAGGLPALDGSHLTGVSAAALNGQAGSFYQNASNLTAGTLDNARLHSDVALLDRDSQIFTGSGQTFRTTDFQIQDSGGTATLLAADTAGMSVTVAGTAANFGNLTITNTHFASTQTTAPTIGTPANCATTPAASVASGSTDSAGAFSITSGSGGGQTSCDTAITFDKAYASAPKSIIVIAETKDGGTGTAAARQIYVSGASTTGFTVKMNSAPAGAAEADWFYYWVIE